jgi:hypothetical protein
VICECSLLITVCTGMSGFDRTDIFNSLCIQLNILPFALFGTGWSLISKRYGVVGSQYYISQYHSICLRTGSRVHCMVGINESMIGSWMMNLRFSLL